MFGQHGTPEYGCGIVGFPDFLALMSDDSSISEESHEYYHSCASVILDRLIGSQYFVTAANAAKVMLFKEAAVHFPKHTGKGTGNKLEFYMPNCWIPLKLLT